MLNEIKRPSLDVTLEVEIPEIQPIKHDLAKVEEFVSKLDTFYRDAINEAVNNFSLDIKDSICSLIIPSITKSFPDNAPAIKYVPASILSGITSW